MGLSGWPGFYVALFRGVVTHLQNGALIPNQPESLSTQRLFQQAASLGYNRTNKKDSFWRLLNRVLVFCCFGDAFAGLVF
jgi:hypothetical protein